MDTSKSENPYFDVKIQTAPDSYNTVRIMMKSNASMSRELFLSKKISGEPVTLSKIYLGSYGINF